jgi:hypothetical protein
MKLLVLTISDNILHGAEKPLLESLTKHGYDYDFYLYGFIFGQQYDIIANYAKNYKGDATHILYSDAWDTLAIAPQEELIRKWETMNNKLLVESLTDPNDKDKRGLKMLISTEKACFPFADKAVLYPETNSQWKYINGGGCLFEIEYMKELVEKHPFKEDYIDPDWLLTCYLANQDNIKLDTNCEVFQTIGHSNREEWEIEDKRVKNIQTNTYPIFIHGNGRTDMQWVRDIA